MVPLIFQTKIQLAKDGPDSVGPDSQSRFSGYQSEKLLQAHHPRMRIPLFSISDTSKLQILPEDVRKGLNMKEIIK